MAVAVPVVLAETDLLLPAAANAIRAVPGWPPGNQSKAIWTARAGRRRHTAGLRVAAVYVRRRAAALVALVASARARLLAATTCLAARAERAPRTVGRGETRVCAVAVDVEPFASRVVKLAALAMVVGRVLLGAGAPLLRVRTQEALVIRMRARVVNNGTTSSVHFARGGVVGTKSRRRSHRNKHREDEKLHRTVDRGDRGDRKALRQSDDFASVSDLRSLAGRRWLLHAAICYTKQ